MYRSESEGKNKPWFVGRLKPRPGALPVCRIPGIERRSEGSSAICGRLSGAGVAGASLAGESGDDARQRRLDEEFVEPGFVGALSVRLFPVPGEGHQQRVLEPGQVAKLPGRLVTVHPRHADIQKDDLGLKLGGDLEGAAPAVGDLHLVAVRRARADAPRTRCLDQGPDCGPPRFPREARRDGARASARSPVRSSLEWARHPPA